MIGLFTRHVFMRNPIRGSCLGLRNNYESRNRRRSADCVDRHYALTVARHVQRGEHLVRPHGSCVEQVEVQCSQRRGRRDGAASTTASACENSSAVCRCRCANLCHRDAARLRQTRAVGGACLADESLRAQRAAPAVRHVRSSACAALPGRGPEHLRSEEPRERRSAGSARSLAGARRCAAEPAGANLPLHMRDQ